jgi:hypothetical protein
VDHGCTASWARTAYEVVVRPGGEGSGGRDIALDILQTQAYGYWRLEYTGEPGRGTTDRLGEVTS